MTNNQFAQPPPENQKEHRSSYPERSRTQGWARIVSRDDHYEVYWKGDSNVMVLITHTLNRRNAEAMVKALNKVIRDFTNITFEPSNVQHPEVTDHQQTQEDRQGGLGTLPNERS